MSRGHDFFFVETYIPAKRVRTARMWLQGRQSLRDEEKAWEGAL